MPKADSQKDGRPQSQDNGSTVDLTHDSRPRTSPSDSPRHLDQELRVQLASVYLQLPAFRNPATSASDSDLNVTLFLADTLS
jgi:hypothetical protein